METIIPIQQLKELADGYKMVLTTIYTEAPEAMRRREVCYPADTIRAILGRGEGAPLSGKCWLEGHFLMRQRYRPIEEQEERKRRLIQQQLDIRN